MFGFKKIKFSWLELLKQLKNDLWCKEVETGYTVSYTWEANQLGHFAIGFVPSVLIMSVLVGIFGFQLWIGLAALASILFMIIKEYGDILAEKSLFAKNPSLFPLAINDIWLNAANACWFSLVGAIVAGLGVFGGWIPLVGLFALCIPTAFIMKYWISQKKCFQQSGLLYITRLSYFSNDTITGVPSEVKKNVDDFMIGEVNHLVISGKTGSGKTKLATAIGTELGFDMVPVRYMDMIDFIDISDSGDEKEVHIAYILWDWKEAEVLIVDDCSVEGLAKLCGNCEAVSIMKNKKIIWVMNNPNDLDIFKQVISFTFRSDTNIKSIILEKKS